MAQSILIVDDEKEIVSMLYCYFSKLGYTVYTATAGNAALKEVEKKPDIILLDVNMPDIDGFTVCERIRDYVSCPIIFLTARIEDSDKIKGFSIGADDYVAKPFHVKELIARVNSLLRRANGEVIQRSRQIHIRDLEIDVDKFLLRRHGNVIDLTPTEFSILRVLSANPDRVFSRMQLMDKIQGGYGFEGYERTIDTHVKNLRKKIEPDPSHPTYILTVYGIGYKFSGGGHE